MLKLYKFFLGITACITMGCTPPQDKKKDIYADNPWTDPDKMMSEDGVYCYNTLADKVCYSKPKDLDGHRLSGYFGPPPPAP